MDMDMDFETVESSSMLFLAGPPGSGKTALGSRVCRDLGLTFLDLANAVRATTAESDSQRILNQIIDQQTVDVVELPWPLQIARGTFALCRRHGHLVGLWAHPLDMRARSSDAELLFTPSARLKTRGGFGLRGTRCAEFKRIDRACHNTRLLVGLSFEQALADLTQTIENLLRADTGLSAERQGMMVWARYWQSEIGADKEATEALVDAMSCYTWHLKSEGASPRSMSAKYDDLNALGYLVLAYEAPSGRDVLNHLSSWSYEYKRKFSDSATIVARYQRTVDDFRRFLTQKKLVCDEERDS
jgi:hypothetical protein